MITVVRRRRKETKFERAIGSARRIGARKSASFLKALKELGKKEDRLKAAAIRRHVKKEGLTGYKYHPKLWYLSFKNGWSVEMPAGHWAEKGRVLQQIVCE